MSNEPVANPLTLVMAIKSPQDYQELKTLISGIQSKPPEENPIVAALTKIGTVHFARFVFLNERELAVITSYDGSFDDYILAFIDAIGGVFNMLLAHIQDAPPLPVEDHSPEFLKYIRENDLKCEPPFYSAYPGLTVVEILALKKQNENE